MPTSKIGLHDLDPSLFETLSNISGSNSQTKIFPLQVVASEDNQTIFPIGLDTFDAEKDFAFVQSGVTNLFYGADFIIENKNIVLKEGVPAGRTLGIYVLKNVTQTDEEDYVSGANLAPGSVTPNKIGGILPIEKGGTGVSSAEEAIKAIKGMQHKQINDTKDFITVLEAVNTCDNSGTFFAVVNTNLINASDSPSPGTEFHYLVLSDDQDRKRVIAFEYGGGEKTGFAIMYTRWAFQGQWRQNEWTKMTEEFLSTNGGTLNYPLYMSNSKNDYPHIMFGAKNIGEQAHIGYSEEWQNLNLEVQGGGSVVDFNVNAQNPLESKLQLAIDNTTWYNIFGEHNKDLLKSVIQEMITNGEIQTGGESVIKHIQRGTGTIGSYMDEQYSIDIALSGFTNINKMIVLLNGTDSYNGSSYDSSYAIVSGVYLNSLSTTSMNIRSNNSMEGMTFSYQVIEYM